MDLTKFCLETYEMLEVEGTGDVVSALDYLSVYYFLVLPKLQAPWPADIHPNLNDEHSMEN